MSSQKNQYFGTDGVRGRYGQKITIDLFERLGFSWVQAMQLQEEHILIGEDTRESSSALAQALGRGIQSAGADVSFLGVLPTPALAFLSFSQKKNVAMISASHNPYYDNGVKFFNALGEKFTLAQEEKIEAYLEQLEPLNLEKKGKTIPPMSWKEAYGDYLIRNIKTDSLQGYSLLLDCANGSFSDFAPAFFNRLGVQVSALAHEPNGKNINDGVGSTHLEHLQANIQHQSLALAFDGDGDRLMGVTPQGRIMDGDDILFLLFEKMRHNNQKPQVLVGTLMTNQGLFDYLQSHQCQLTQTPVGDRHLYHALKDRALPLGGENSGHIIPHYIPSCTTGDGLLVALLLLEYLAQEEHDVDALLQRFPRHAQVLINLPFDASCEELDDALSPHVVHWEGYLKQKGGGRILIRKSGTEPLLRVLVESSCEDVAREACEALVKIAKNIQSH